MAAQSMSERRRAFWTYWTASTGSGIGSAVTTIALPLLAVLTLHASTLQMGLLTAASECAWLLVGLPAGAMVQHARLRMLQVSLDLIRAIATISLPVAWWMGHLTMAQVLLVALVISFANVFFGVANTTFLPAVVPREELQSRNALMSGTDATTQLGGPALGGILVQALGAAAALVVDAVSYVFSAALLSRLPERRTESKPAEIESLRERVAQGWRFIRKHRAMNACTWSAACINFVCGAQMTLFTLYLVRVLHVPAGWVGLILASEGVGALIGSPFAVRLETRMGSARTVIVAAVVAAFGALVLALGSGPLGIVLFIAGNTTFAFGVVIFSITTRTFRQTATPPELLSRVMGTVRFMSWGAIPIGGGLAGVVASAMGIRTALIVFGAVTVISPALLLASPVRHLRDLAGNHAQHTD